MFGSQDMVGCLSAGLFGVAGDLLHHAVLLLLIQTRR
ncbi:hypothetical protein HNO89_002863 [Sporosarcina luteola]|nr:hypothetical protein [Sporosarcina luteola]